MLMEREQWQCLSMFQSFKGSVHVPLACLETHSNMQQRGGTPSELHHHLISIQGLSHSHMHIYTGKTWNQDHVHYINCDNALGPLAVESTCPVECVTGVRVSRYHTWHSHVSRAIRVCGPWTALSCDAENELFWGFECMLMRKAGLYTTIFSSPSLPSIHHRHYIIGRSLESRKCTS